MAVLFRQSSAHKHQSNTQMKGTNEHSTLRCCIRSQVTTLCWCTPTGPVTRKTGTDTYIHSARQQTVASQLNRTTMTSRGKQFSTRNNNINTNNINTLAHNTEKAVENRHGAPTRAPTETHTKHKHDPSTPQGQPNRRQPPSMSEARGVGVRNSAMS